MDFEYKEQGQYVAYTATLSDGFKTRRTIFFASSEEKDQFM